MSIKESMLNIVSDLAQNDYIRAVTYGGYSRRVEVSELAKSVVEDYTGSSLAGDNQSVQGAFSALETEIQTVEQDVTTEINDAILNILPTDTAAGEIASFQDGSDLSPALSVVAGIEPVQDLHGYGSPWPAGAGKNKFPPFPSYTANGITFTANADGSVKITGSATANVSNILDVDIQSGTYTLSLNMTGESSSGRLRFMDANNTSMQDVYLRQVNSVVTITLSSAIKHICCTIASGATDLDITIKPQLESGSSATSFAPYENICPISGHDEVGVSVVGVNQWDEEWESGQINITTGENTAAPNNIRSKNYIPIIPNKTYFVYKSSTAWGFVKLYYDANKNYISYASNWNAETFTTPSNAHYMRFYCGSEYGTTYNNDISINYPSTDHDYHAYNGTTTTTTLPSTTYGGTVDVVSGVLTVDRAITSGAIDWTRMSSSYQYGTFQSDAIADLKYSANSPMAICSCYAPSTAQSVESYDDGVIWARSSSGYRLVIKDTSKENMTDAEFKTFMSDKQIVYYLATPQTIQLTETQVVELFKGYNNVFSEAGDMSVTYKADIQLYIDKQTNELRVAILALS